MVNDKVDFDGDILIYLPSTEREKYAMSFFFFKWFFYGTHFNPIGLNLCIFFV